MEIVNIALAQNLASKTEYLYYITHYNHILTQPTCTLGNVVVWFNGLNANIFFNQHIFIYQLKVYSMKYKCFVFAENLWQ